MNSKRWISIGALFCFVTVALGALGAHMLKERLVGEYLEWWLKAVGYGGGHALGLIAFGLLGERVRAKNWIGWCFVLGIVCFSGTLYAMALGAPRWFAHVTPIGGVAFLVAWLGVALATWNAEKRVG